MYIYRTYSIKNNNLTSFEILISFSINLIFIIINNNNNNNFIIAF